MQKKITTDKRGCGMTTTIITAVITGIVCLVAGGVVGYMHRKKTAEAEIGSAEAQARKILEDGIKSAETKKKVVVIGAGVAVFLIWKKKKDANKQIEEEIDAAIDAAFAEEDVAEIESVEFNA